MKTKGEPGSMLWADAVETLRAQVVSLRSVMLLIYTPIALLFVIVILVRMCTGIAIAEFTRDPLGFTDIPVYTGSISNLGVILWSGTAAVCFFVYGLSRTRDRSDSTARFMLTGGVLTGILLLDDLFMLHEVVIPRYLGFIQDGVYAIYVLLLTWFLVRFHAVIRKTAFLLLAPALAGFGASVSVGYIAPRVSIPGLYVLEDGAKLFGIVSWAAYFVLVGARRLAPANVPEGKTRHCS